MPMVTKEQLAEYKALKESVETGDMPVVSRLEAMERKFDEILRENANLKEAMKAGKQESGPTRILGRFTRADVEAWAKKPLPGWEYFCVESRLYTMTLFDDKPVMIDPLNPRGERRSERLDFECTLWNGPGSDLTAKPMFGQTTPPAANPLREYGWWNPVGNPKVLITEKDVEQFAPWLLNDRKMMEKIAAENGRGMFPVAECVGRIKQSGYYRRRPRPLIVDEERFRNLILIEYKVVWNEQDARAQRESLYGRLDDGAEKTGIFASEPAAVEA